jgi:hypothetical protein
MCSMFYNMVINNCIKNIKSIELNIYVNKINKISWYNLYEINDFD